MTKTTQVLGTDEMQRLVKQLKMVGATVNPAPIVRLKVGFENAETVELPGTAIQDLTIIQGKTSEKAPCLAGFYLKLVTEQLLPATWQRLQEYADITDLTVMTMHQTVKYQTIWSPLSDSLGENVNQFCTRVPGYLEVATKVPRFYDWAAILAATAGEPLLAMASKLKAQTGYAENECLNLLRSVIETLQAVQADMVATAYLVVRHESTGSADWTPAICKLDQQGAYFDGIDTVPTAELLAMPVQVESTDEFWDGMSWLFYQLSLNETVEATRRAEQHD